MQGQYKAPFTIFLNAVPREKTFYIAEKGFLLRCGGIKRQRELLEKEGKLETAQSWTWLNVTPLTLQLAKIGNSVYDKIKNHDFKYQDIPSGLLKDYFSSDEPNKWQKWELNILEANNFDIETGHYLSVPLLKFGEIDGLAHIVYPDETKALFEDENNVKNIVNGFAIECEGVFLAWDLQEDDQERAAALRVKIDELAMDEWYKEGKADPIFVELGFPEYYKTHHSYFRYRLAHHDRTLLANYEQVQRQSVITILMDSYAHNISAHALASLTWIFKQRFELKLKKMQLEKALKAIKKYAADIRAEAEIKIQEKYSAAKYKGAYNDLINFPDSLTIELYPFFKFLLEKGGFWSGLTRDHSGGGQVTNMYSTLWYEFVVNALYLGTIAESEDVTRIHVDVTIYEPKNNAIKGSQNGFTEYKKTKIAGRLATIDLSKEVKHHYDVDQEDWYVLLPDGKTPLTYKRHHGLENLSRFVQPGTGYETLKEALRDINVFFPGGVVGKQAFYTIIENELRNIKHHDGPALRKAQKEGLVLNISVQPTSLSDNGNTELYEIGIWLGISSPLSQHKRKDGSPLLVKRRFDLLWQDIIEDRTYKPRLGGTNQDKVCAAMLFNNTFSDVQKGGPRYWVLDSVEMNKRDQVFYPWVTPAVCFKEDETIEFRIAAPGSTLERKNYLENLEDFNNQINAQYQAFKAKNGHEKNQGFLKKYFYLWHGEEIRQSQDETELTWDNLGRFKFVYAAPDNHALWKKARENGVIRVIRGLPEINEQQPLLTEVYKTWLVNWIGETSYAMTLEEEDTRQFLGGYLLDASKPEKINFFIDATTSSKPEDMIQPYGGAVKATLSKLVNASPEERRLKCAHSSNKTPEGCIHYRSHGVINRYFSNSDSRSHTREISLRGISEAKLLELFEMLVTKICILDNRVEHRIKGRHEFYKNQLKVQFFSEQTPKKTKKGWTGKWETIYKPALKNTNFLVIHLSYLERILEVKYHGHPDFKDGNIGLFIEQEIAGIVGTETSGSLRDNFILVITTGRGRQNWREFLDQERYKKYRHSVIFRPIESILAAVEDSIMIKDDFELKHRLTKILFGS